MWSILSSGFCWHHFPPTIRVLSFPSLYFLEQSAKAFLMRRCLVNTYCLNVLITKWINADSGVPSLFTQKLGMSQGKGMGKTAFSLKASSCFPVMSSTRKERWGMKLRFVKQSNCSSQGLFQKMLTLNFQILKEWQDRAWPFLFYKGRPLQE